jgi:hypothetical protein
MQCVIAVLLAGFLSVGCFPPVPPQPTTNTVVSAGVLFDNYKHDVAKNFRELATNCRSGKYEYVSELVDDAIALDKVAKYKRSNPIDQRFSESLGSDKIDAEKAAILLDSIAKELE